MKQKRIIRLFSALFLAAGFAFSGCSSDKEYVMSREGGESPQEQVERQKQQSDYTKEDWFYDYYDLSDEEELESN